MALSSSKSDYLSLPDRSAGEKEYLVWSGCGFIKLRWSEMTLHQRLQEIESERRADYDANFDPCGILF